MIDANEEQERGKQQAAAAPPPAAPPPSGEAGFAPEDFTGSIRLPAPVAGGADMFEEEYGQVDVESAIAAFEKSHPEFEYGDATEPGTGSVPGDVAPGPEASHPEPAPAAEWLNEERESAAPPPAPPPPP